MSHLVSSGPFPVTWLRGLVWVLCVAACIAAFSAIITHDFGDHYRSGEIGRMAPHHAVLAQSDDARGDKTRQTGRGQARNLLPTIAAARIKPVREFESAPRPSLCRRLLRLKLGLRSHADEDPSNFLT
jgi:hypothetical protein